MKSSGGKLIEYDKQVVAKSKHGKLSLVSEAVIYEDLRERTILRYRHEPFKSEFDPIKVSEYAQKQLDYQEYVSNYDPNV
jgi:hypothetical protein